MDVTSYKILNDGFAILDSPEKITQFFKDSDIIGKIVKRADICRSTDGASWPSYGSIDGRLFPASHHGLDSKMLFSDWTALYFICEFADSTWLMIDYSGEGTAFARYGSDGQLPFPYFECLLPGAFDGLFLNLEGKELDSIDISSSRSIYRDSDNGSHCCRESLGSLFLNFRHSGSSVSCESGLCRDAVGLYCGESQNPWIAFYTNRDVSYVEFKNLESIGCKADEAESIVDIVEEEE